MEIIRFITLARSFTVSLIKISVAVQKPICSLIRTNTQSDERKRTSLNRWMHLVMLGASKCPFSSSIHFCPRSSSMLIFLNLMNVSEMKMKGGGEITKHAPIWQTAEQFHLLCNRVIAWVSLLGRSSSGDWADCSCALLMWIYLKPEKCELRSASTWERTTYRVDEPF